MQDNLRGELLKRQVSPSQIDDVLDAGYCLRNWYDPATLKTCVSVSDMMYGNKQLSSCFDIDKFAKYVKGECQFPSSPPFRTFTIKTRTDIAAILSENSTRRYAEQGSLSFRGQHREHTFKRKIPNPVRANSSGSERSILAGIYRQRTPYYSFNQTIKEARTIEAVRLDLEPNGAFDGFGFYDFMRTEQHYATQTAGLDITFEIETAIFFATHAFKLDADGRAYYERIARGQHRGVIYGFVFVMPFVTETQYLIRDFDYFKINPPERILRQRCGLPLFGDNERNIAVTDLDFIMLLHPDFDYETTFTPEYMFPCVAEDSFYARLLELKERHPEGLSGVVEYRWARGKK